MQRIKCDVELQHIDPRFAEDAPLAVFGVLADQRLDRRPVADGAGAATRAT